MVDFYAPVVFPLLTDYGCVGRGHFNASEPTVGMPKDEIDSAFLWWKKCIHCAKVEYNALSVQYNGIEFTEYYQFDQVEDRVCSKCIFYQIVKRGKIMELSALKPR
jgi:hypothetical protein